MIKTTILVAVTLVLPLVWGWAMHLLLKRLWPVHAATPARPGEGHGPPLRAPDYQI